MSKEATDLVLGLAAFEQAEYAEATARKTTPAADVEGASASGAQTEQWVTVPRIANTPAPQWAAADEATGDLLDLLANEHPAIPSKAEEWETFLAILKAVAAENEGVIDQNQTRPRLHGVVTAQRVGPMFRRACREGRIRPEGYTTTTNSTSGNGGKPAVAYRWLVA